MRWAWLTELKRLVRQLRKQGPHLAVLSAWDKLTRMYGNHPMGRYNRIVPKIILGGQPARRHLLKLAQAGVTGVINMREEHDYAEAVGNTNLDYLQLPTEDNTAPEMDDLCRGVDFIHTQLAEGGSVYIHCWEGLGRGPTMVAAYFVSLGDTPEEAWRKIRKARPFIRPTPDQVEVILEFEEDLRQGRYEVAPDVVPSVVVTPDEVQIDGLDEAEDTEEIPQPPL